MNGNLEENYDEKDFTNANDLTNARRIYRRRPKTARNLVSDVITRRGIAAEQSNHELQGVWDSIVGMDIANQTKIGSIRRGVLNIEVSNSSLLQHLEFSKHEFKDLINQQMRKAEIKDLRFRIGSIS